MNKSHIVLVLGLLAVIMISNLEDYISSPEFSFGERDSDAVDYYLTDFKLSAITDEGKISHTLSGDYLAHWQQRKTSFIIRPELTSNDDNATDAQRTTKADAIKLNAEEAVLDHSTNTAELSGQVNLLVDNDQSPQLTLKTAQLQYQIDNKHITTTEAVRITTPQLQLSGTGLDIKLDESYLRLNTNVKSTYQAN
ncbi:MAG: LPS export ABC transporter protein LptC [uncultured Thiotrichaceae bacterium]|uniref:LPS export ABC transporter protein LptC n=1 Tax=uncultured Thiotrichaceae bacterium TaxID=298394 RepID=A0A6S6TLQ9_9GAMM|nr:MAG: LPS export ABC transporter protein LptC [uncultured Thiotrichaceae bacterium]